MFGLNLKYSSRIGMIFGVLLLSACSYMHHQQQRFEHQKACRAHCDERYRHCMQVCDDNEKLCRIKRDAIAAVHFARYKQQQNLKGQVITEELKAFRDPLACLKTTCDCEQDKMMCKQAYRGAIYKRLQYAMQLN